MSDEANKTDSYIRYNTRTYKSYEGWVDENRDLTHLKNIFEKVMSWYKKQGIEIKNPPKLYVLSYEDIGYMERVENETNVEFKYSKSPMFLSNPDVKYESEKNYLSEILRELPYDEKILTKYIEESINKNQQYFKEVLNYLTNLLSNHDLNNILFINPVFVGDLKDTYNRKVLESCLVHELWHIYEKHKDYLLKPAHIVSEGSATYVQEMYTQEVLKDNDFVEKFMNPLYIVSKREFDKYVPKFLPLNEKEYFILNDSIREEVLKETADIIINYFKRLLQKGILKVLFNKS